MALAAESQRRRWEGVVQASRSTGRLQLRGAGLDAGSAATVVQLLLSEEKQPWHVDLEGNELGDRGALCLAELLRQSTHLAWLGLGACGIGPLGGVALASALSESRSLTALDLSSSAAMAGPVRNSLGRKVRDGAPVALPAPPTEEALLGGLSRRGKPRAAPPGAGLPRAPPSSAPALAWAGEEPTWAGVAPGPPEALLERLGQGYLLSDAELARLSSEGEIARGLEEDDPHFELAARRWRHAHQPRLAELLRTAVPPDDGAFSQPALKVLQAAPLLPRRQRPSSAAASARGLPPQVPAVAVALIALAEAVATAPRLATLKLGGNGIGHDGARELCALLQRAPGLTALHVPRNGLGAQGAAALAPAAAASGTLRLLDLSLNEIGDEGVCALARAFGEAGAGGAGGDDDAGLTALSLTANGISVRGARALADVLGSGLRRLSSLRLGKNSLLPAGASALAAALPGCSLTELHLAGCYVADQGAAALGAALSAGARLTTLDLSANGVADAGAAALADCLVSAGALQALLLGGNNIGDAGGVALGDALGPARLHTLDLKDNGLGAGAGAALLRGVISHSQLQAQQPSLTTLELAGTEVPYATALRCEAKLRALRQGRADESRARLHEQVVRLQGAQASLGQVELELKAAVAEREANEGKVRMLEEEVRRARAAEAAAETTSAEEVRLALGSATAAAASLREGATALSVSQAEWKEEAARLEASLRATQRRVLALTARREAAARGEEVADSALSVELPRLLEDYRAAERAASSAHDRAEYALVRLKERARALRQAGVNVTLEEVPAHLSLARPAPACTVAKTRGGGNRRIKHQEHGRGRGR